MLYNENEQTDLNNVLAAADGFVLGLGVEGTFIQTSKIKQALLCMREDFPAKGGLGRASAFKKCANFLCFLVAEGPILRPFPGEAIGAELSKIYNHQNAMLGFHIVVDALHNAEVIRDDRTVVLSNRVKMSPHSYTDTIQALASITPQSHFHLVSVFLEQLCYKANPDASYAATI